MNCLPKLVTAAFLSGAVLVGADLVGKLPGHVKLVQGIAPAREAPAPKSPQANQEQLLRRAREAARSRCAHIIVYGADPNVDRGILVRPGGPSARTAENMPVHPALPVCPEDIRQPAITPPPSRQNGR